MLILIVILLIIIFSTIVFFKCVKITREKAKKSFLLADALKYFIGESFKTRSLTDEKLQDVRSSNSVEYQANLILFSYICCDFSLGDNPKLKDFMPALYASILTANECTQEVKAYIKKHGDRILNNYWISLKGLAEKPQATIVFLGKVIYSQIAVGCIEHDLFEQNHGRTDAFYQTLGDFFIARIREINTGFQALLDKCSSGKN